MESTVEEVVVVAEATLAAEMMVGGRCRLHHHLRRRRRLARPTSASNITIVSSSPLDRRTMGNMDSRRGRSSSSKATAAANMV